MDIHADHRYEDNTKEELLAEITEFEREREQLKMILGKIGGRDFSKKDTWINFIFLVGVVGLFVMELVVDFIPRLLSLEVGVLLVSMKIVFMMHSQQKVNHFQFWILNSIEYRMNDMAKRVKKIEKVMHQEEPASSPQS